MCDVIIMTQHMIIMCCHAAKLTMHGAISLCNCAYLLPDIQLLISTLKINTHYNLL